MMVTFSKLFLSHFESSISVFFIGIKAGDSDQLQVSMIIKFQKRSFDCCLWAPLFSFMEKKRKNAI